MSSKKQTRNKLAELSRDNFYAFLRSSPTAEGKKFKHTKFHEYLAYTLQGVAHDTFENNKSRWVLLSVPPRHGKTYTTCQSFPAWCFGAYQKHSPKFIVTSYSPTMTAESGGNARNIINSPFYRSVFPDVHLRSDKKSKLNFGVESGGSYFGTGVGSPVTGFGANCVTKDTTIYTNGSDIAIDNIAVGDKVLAYDHRTNQYTYTEVKAVSIKKRTQDFIRIGDLRATPDHRIYTKGSGYVRAEEVSQSDEFLMLPMRKGNEQENWGNVQTTNKRWSIKSTLFSSLRKTTHKGKQKATKSVPLRISDSGTCGNVSSVSRETGTRKSCGEKMSALFKNIFHDSSRTQPWRWSLLWQELLQRISKRESEQWENKNNNSLRALRSKVRTKKSWSKVLFAKMCDLFQAKPCGRLQRSVVNFETICPATRWANLPVVWEQALSNECSPYGRQQNEPQHKQSSNTVHAVPRHASSARGDTPKKLAELFGLEDYVVDIQTTTENFFAEGILVHNCLLIDDPYKGRREAESGTVQRDVQEYFESTLLSRIEANGSLVVIMQRWNQNDLVQFIIDNHPKWKKKNPGLPDLEIISFPAIAEEDEYYPSGKLFREAGESLAPEVGYTVKEMLGKKATMDPYYWFSQYQQNPIDKSAAKFKKEMFRYYTPADIKGKFLVYYTFIDPAISKKEGSDELVILTLGYDVENDYVYRIHETAGHYDPEEFYKVLYDEHLSRYRIKELVIEAESFQQVYRFGIEKLRDRIRGGFIINEFRGARLRGGNNKEHRIEGLLGFYQRGVILHRDFGDEKYEEQLLTFPNGRHDDRIDCMSFFPDFMIPKYSREVEVDQVPIDAFDFSFMPK